MKENNDNHVCRIDVAIIVLLSIIAGCLIFHSYDARQMRVSLDNIEEYMKQPININLEVKE